MNTFVITTLYFNVLYYVSLLCAITREYRRISNPFFFKNLNIWLRAKIYNYAFRWVTYDEESLH